MTQNSSQARIFFDTFVTSILEIISLHNSLGIHCVCWDRGIFGSVNQFFVLRQTYPKESQTNPNKSKIKGFAEPHGLRVDQAYKACSEQVPFHGCDFFDFVAWPETLQNSHSQVRMLRFLGT